MPVATVTSPRDPDTLLDVAYRVTRPARRPRFFGEPGLHDEGFPAEIELESVTDEDGREVLHILTDLEIRVVEDGVFAEGVDDE